MNYVIKFSETKFARWHYNRRHDTQHNDIQHNDTQHIGLISDIQHSDILPLRWMSLFWVSLFYLLLCWVSWCLISLCLRVAIVIQFHSSLIVVVESDNLHNHYRAPNMLTLYCQCETHIKSSSKDNLHLIIFIALAYNCFLWLNIHSSCFHGSKK
jgi:hypothetical protein